MGRRLDGAVRKGVRKFIAPTTVGRQFLAGMAEGGAISTHTRIGTAGARVSALTGGARKLVKVARAATMGPKKQRGRALKKALVRNIGHSLVKTAGRVTGYIGGRSIAGFVGQRRRIRG